MFQHLLTAVGILSVATDAQTQPRRRCAHGDDCWPDTQTWNDFNATVGGRLIRSVPSAAVCHTERYNADKCSVAKESWLDSFWRTNQTGAYSATVWEMGQTGQCFINTSASAPCDQGIVPYYMVRATSVEDIQASVKFANEKDLLLVTKNTGHDHLGRSSGKGAFGIWTHNLKGIEFQSSFTPQGAPPDSSGIPAVTLQAGEQWFDVYQAAAKQGVLVVGGSARTVGAAGGYVLGGGHSPFAHYYGLAADNVLEVTIVSADGEHRVLNTYTDPDYFWAVRGGGGSAWGVVTSVTYKTHPVPQNLTMGLVQLNATSESSFKQVIAESVKLLPAVTEAGYTGYGTIENGFAAIFLKPNSTIADFNQTFAPFFNLSRVPGIQGVVAAYPSTWDGYLQNVLQDPNIGTNIQDTSRLLTLKVMQEKADDLAEFIVDSKQGAGFNFSKSLGSPKTVIRRSHSSIFVLVGKVNNDKRDNTAVHDVWKHSHGLLSVSVDWADTATDSEKESKRQQTVQLSKRLTEIVGSEGGTYVNEANPYEPDWQNVFWGKKYDRLLAIKHRVDPTTLFVCNRCVGTDIVIQP
ncbi:FAD binding domain protein [Aspergillus flavus AF70]|nr:FAD binding domain protein [Aspergillus flavus AF70]